MKIFKNLAIAIAVYTLAATAASGGQVTGTIGSLDAVPNSTVYSMRVVLTGGPPLCSGAGDPAWGYINASDTNYKGASATLMLAMSLSKNVQLTTSLDAGYCKIDYIKVYN